MNPAEGRTDISQRVEAQAGIMAQALMDGQKGATGYSEVLV